MFARAALLLLVAIGLAAEEIPDSKGRDFWFCFMPNYHNSGYYSDAAQERDSIYIFIAAESPTAITLEFTPHDGRPRQQIQGRIADPTQMLVIKMSYHGVELIGINLGGSTASLARRHTQRPVPYSLHLVSEQDVTVYALNRAETTSDAFLILPTDALGKDYYVMSYNTDVYGYEQNTPSQFAVVATEDSTVVEFLQITAPTTDGAVSRVLLNQGEVYLVQSMTNNEQYDLTGTRIKSNRPIAVFGGHQRVRVPLQSRRTTSSRDCLIEQIPPTATWGRSAYIVPLVNPPDSIGTWRDRYRILAARDSTVVYLDSVPLLTLNAGQFYEGDLLQPHVIHANRPILVAQFQRTSTPVGLDDLLLGDPFMMIIPPVEQFLSSYRFACPLSYQYTPSGITLTEVYRYHFVTIVCHDTTHASVRVDGRPVTQQFYPIPKSEYVYTTVRLSPGVHTAEATAPIGIYVYGYGYADSYGYIGGMSFRRYDFEPPKLSSLSPCSPYRLVVYDTLPSDSRIDVVRVVEDSSENVSWQIVRQTLLPEDSVEVFIWLRDPFEDGLITLIAQDAEQFITNARIPIPGMTLRILNQNGGIRRFPITYTYRSATQRSSCFRVPIFNVGRFAQTILGASARVGVLQTDKQLPLTVLPADSVVLQVCFRSIQTTKLTDTLWLETPCGRYAAAIFTVEFIYDTLPPRIQRAEQPCPPVDILTVEEHGYTQTGIARVSVLDSFNVDISISASPEQVLSSAEEQTIRVAQRDWRQDAWYAIEVADSVGNMQTIEGAFLGHTVTIANRDSLDPRATMIGKSNQFFCDTVELYNYGRYPKTFDRMVSRGIELSVPPAYLPLVLEPGQRVRVPVCALMPFYNATHSNIYHDTVELRVGCFTRTMPVELRVDASSYVAESSCGVIVRSHSDSVATVGLVYDGSTLRVHFDRHSEWHGMLYTTSGRCIMQVQQQGTALDVNLSGIPAGVYWLRVRGPRMEARVPILWTGQ